MQKSLQYILLILIVVFGVSQIMAQERRGQFELYAGAGIPLGPDNFKDFYKLGISLNGQYVFFPSPQLGIPIFAGYEFFSVDSDAISEEFRGGLVGLPIEDEFGNILGQVTDASLDSEGSASIIRFGAGVRPYLTPPTASTQFFLFGNATYNLIKTKQTLNGGSVTARDNFGNTEIVQITAADFREISETNEFEDDDNKIGLAIGAGFEIPAGESFNLIIQGLFNFILTESEEEDLGDGTTEEVGGTTSFVGITAGVVF